MLAASAPADAAGRSTIEITSKTGVHAFNVELATNDAERERGLMFRKSLPEGRGMLFDFKVDQQVSFWMHNTYIPLDMIFITGSGRIVHVAENAKPMSDTLIPSEVLGAGGAGSDRRYGGTARHCRRRPGDRRDFWQWRLKAVAGWPACWRQANAVSKAATGGV